MNNPIAQRPWLLVILAFLIVIGVWITVTTLSKTIPHKRLTPAQEAQILQSGGKKND